jgi:calcium-independent phospholipase A2-gamma
VSTLVSTFPPEIYLFRNYNYPVDTATPSRYSGTCRTLLHRALRASTAGIPEKHPNILRKLAPSYFDEMLDGDKRFQDGGLMCNNPTAAALHEAKKLWPNRKVVCIVSLGTGREPPKSGRTGLQATLLTLIESATNVERIHEALEDTLDEKIYYRFNPVHAIFESKLDETRREKLEALQAATKEFIENNIEKITEVANLLASDL